MVQITLPLQKKGSAVHMFSQPDWKTIKKKLYFQLNYSSLYVMWFLRWLVFGAITGIVCGLVGAAFLISINWVTAARQANDWQIGRAHV